MQTIGVPPSISVVVPTYNRAGMIGHTLDAILAQDLPPDEIIVVDDGSTDATAQRLAAYAPRVRAIRVANGGDLKARNIGMREATGDLVAFCDSDDLWRPHYLRTVLQLWRHEPDLFAAYGNFRLVRQDVWHDRAKYDDAPAGFWDGLRHTAPDQGVFDTPITVRILDFQPFFPSAMVANRARFLAAGGWDEAPSRIVGSDIATVLRVTQNRIGVTLQPLVGIRRHETNMSADVQAMNLGDARVLEMCLAAMPALQAQHARVLASIASRRAAAADTAFDRRDFAAVREIYKMLPPEQRSWRRRVKFCLSHLPPALAKRAPH